ncbi:hypothetical protein J4Q44_G00308990 [Coregonus suidteri]|uniref:Uncharacterized protein n=1 Tax=Coregonus suidteri TaxID=861788 RepID=A0AAN8QC71_9TELE
MVEIMVEILTHPQRDRPSLWLKSSPILRDRPSLWLKSSPILRETGHHCRCF